MLPDELAQIYFVASVEAGIPRRISRKSKQFQFFERIAKLLKNDDDPYTYFKVLFGEKLVWPHEMATERAYSIYQEWKLARLSAGTKPFLRGGKDKIVSDVINWEETYRSYKVSFKEFIDKSKLQVSPYWVALHDEWEEVKDEAPYELFREVKKARIWLKKHGAFMENLKGLIYGRDREI